MKRQATLNKVVSLSGMGLFTGSQVSVQFCPAKPNTGIVFQRIDLPEQPKFTATLSKVVETNRTTTLGNKNHKLLLVEHVLSALYAYGVNNLLIQVDGPELPVGDGSAKLYTDLIEKAKIRFFETTEKIHVLKEPLHWSQDQVHLIALPSDAFKISYTLHYPKSQLLQSQFFSSVITPDIYKEELAPCRTFCLYEEVAQMMQKGLLKGAGLDNGVVIKGSQILNPEGLRFQDEMVRHKVVDLLGDLSLMGISFQAHILAVCSGHSSNVAFGKVLKEHLMEMAHV